MSRRQGSIVSLAIQLSRQRAATDINSRVCGGYLWDNPVTP
jgi:hypothetical protein